MFRSDDNPRTPTFKFDSLYSRVFAQHPTLVFVLKSQIFGHLSLAEVVRSLVSNFRVFQPFVEIRELLVIPFPSGDSPLDFLRDPRRAGQFYSHPADIAEEMMLLWIRTTMMSFSEDEEIMM